METSLNKNIIKEKQDKIPVLKLFWRMMIYKKGLYAWNCFLWVLIHIEPLILGVLFKVFFDILNHGERFTFNLTAVVVGMLLYAVMRVANIYIGAKVDNLHRFIMSGLIRRNIFESILEKPGAQAIACSSGEALNSFRDDAEMIEDSISWTLDFIGNIVFAAVAILILMSINVKITLLVFTPLIAVVAVVQMLSSKLQKYRKDAREATGLVTGAMGEIFSSVQAIKVAGEEKNVINYIDSLNKKRHKFMVKDKLLMQLLDSIFYNTVSLGTGFILLLAAALMRNGELTIGELSLFIYYLNFVADFTSFFGEFIAHNRQASIAFKRMADLMQEASPEKVVEHKPLYIYEKDMKNAKNQAINYAPLKELEIRNLSYKYSSSGNGIEDVSFTVKKGSFTVITGRVGSGKSTLVKAIIGLLLPDRGEVCWNGEIVDKPQEFFVAPHSAYTPQIPNLVSDSIKNNILFGLEENRVDLQEAIYASILEEDLTELENGLDTLIGPKGMKLSGGQIQRVAAARMFFRKADLMVFDDISSALDVATENKLWTRIFQKRQATCLVVSNRKAALKKADQIIVMRDGKIYAKGTLEELLESCDEMQEIWG